MIKQLLGKKGYERLKAFIKRFWFIPVCVAYFLTNNWVIGNFILLYLGFKAGTFWREYKALVVSQGERWKQEWGLKNEGLHENDCSGSKGNA